MLPSSESCREIHRRNTYTQTFPKVLFRLGTGASDTKNGDFSGTMRHGTH